MKKVIYLVAFQKKSGGAVYGRHISALPYVKTVYMWKSEKGNRFLKLIRGLIYLYRFRKRNLSSNILIRTPDSCFFLREKDRNIVIVHHHHPYSKNFFIRYYQKLIFLNLLRMKKKIDVLVVVSDYWRKFFEKKGFKNVVVVYNPFDIDAYRLKTESKKKEFVKKYNLDNKPIIYLGNPQKEKGTDKSYEMLKSLNAHFVTTGIKKIDLPVKHLNLSFNEYVTMLQVASVSVLMSQIKEGWNRVAHESILCGTPVIGTGKGGMKELLESTDQTICTNWQRLPEIVRVILKKQQKPSREAMEYVRSFNLERFKNSWEKIIFDKEESK